MLSLVFKGACAISGAVLSESSLGKYSASSNTTDYYVYSQDYLRKMLSASRRATSKMIESSLNYYLDATEYKYVGVPFIGGGGVPRTAYKKAAASRLEMYFPLLVPVISSFKFQILSFEVLKMFKLPLFFIAILLRFLPFTRDAGNVLISLFLALYVIYPFTMLFNAISFDNIPACSSNGDYLANGNDVVFSCNFITYINKDGNQTGSIAYLAQLFPQAFFLPNLSILITFTSAKALFNGLKFVSARFGAV